MSSIISRYRSLARVASVAAALSGCADQEGTDQTEAIQEPIYHGTVSTDLASGNVMLQLDGDIRCSGTIYSDYWVLTAAHCFQQLEGWPLDTNDDKQISSSEGAGRYSVTPGPNAYNQAASLPARRIFVHPQGSFGGISGVDIVMIWVGEPGFYSNFLSTYAYSSGKLNIDPVPATSLLGMNVLASGYGYSGYGDYGVLRSGWKLVSEASSGWYVGSLVNGAGTTCLKDSGGSDRRWTGAAWVVTGVHSIGDPGCAGGPDGQPGPEWWGSWVNTKDNSCPDVTRRGRCHF